MELINKYLTSGTTPFQKLTSYDSIVLFNLLRMVLDNNFRHLLNFYLNSEFRGVK